MPIYASWPAACVKGVMGHSMAGGKAKPVNPVATYLSARGILKTKLPPDLLRELTRLLADQPRTQDEETGGLDSASHGCRDLVQEHHHDMVSFEMYLAAWIAREGICDTPRKRRRVKRKPGS